MRTYNKRDYVKIDPAKLSTNQLKELINNMAATVNARVKAASKLAKSDQLLNQFLNENTSDLLQMVDSLRKTNPEYFTKSGTLKRSVSNLIKNGSNLVDIASAYQDIVVQDPATTTAKKEVAKLEQSMPEVIKQYRKGNKYVVAGLNKKIQDVAQGLINPEESQYTAYTEDMASAAGKLYREKRDAGARDYLIAIGKEEVERDYYEDLYKNNLISKEEYNKEITRMNNKYIK